MADHIRPDPDPEVTRGMIARVRSHLMDVTPVRISADFRRLFIGRAISEFGDEMVAVAVPFQVYMLTRSTLAVGLLGLCELVPVIVFPIIGGAVADAVERRRFMIGSHLFLALMSTAMAVNAALDEPRLWPLYVFATLSAGMYTFNRPALDTWPARLLPPDLLPSAAAFEAGWGTAVGMLGPVIAGVLLATISPTGVFLVDAATFLAAIASVFRMAPSPPSEDAPSIGWAAIADGFRFLRGRRVLQSVFLADLNAMVFGFPMALFPAVADSLSTGNGAAVLGLLTAAPALGAFLSTAFSGRARHVRRQGRAILVAIVVWGAAIVVFGLSDTLWLSLVMLAVAGAGDMVSGIFRQAILLAAVEDRFRGRLDGIGMAVWATGPSIGNVESGVVASLTSVPFSIVSGGLLTIAGVGMLRWFAPGFWRYDARDPHP
jgi:MFS family permease